MSEVFADFVNTTLAANIGPTATSLSVASGAGATLPQPTGGNFGRLILVDQVTSTRREIITFTTISGDGVSNILRGQEGTTAQSWSSGDIIISGPTAGTQAQFVQKDQAQSNAATYAPDTGSVNAYAVAPTPAVPNPPVAGTRLYFKALAANTGASTISVSGTSYPLVGNAGALTGGEIAANSNCEIVWNSSYAGFELVTATRGELPVPVATKPQHAVQFSQVSGVVGASRNAVMNVSAASATATMTADEIIVESALGGLRYCLAGFNKSINLATTGAGGMDVGGAPVSGFVGIYAISNPTTGASALLARNATSSAVSEVYGGANMPAGYTASALVGVVPTNASGQIVPLFLQGRRVAIVNVSVLSTSSQPGSFTAFSIASAVPLNAVSASIGLQLSNTTNSASESYTVASTTTGINKIPVTGQVVGSSGNAISAGGEISVVTPQTLYYMGGGGTPLFAVTVGAFSF